MAWPLIGSADQGHMGSPGSNSVCYSLPDDEFTPGGGFDTEADGGKARALAHREQLTLCEGRDAGGGRTAA